MAPQEEKVKVPEKAQARIKSFTEAIENLTNQRQQFIEGVMLAIGIEQATLDFKSMEFIKSNGKKEELKNK